MCKGCPKQVAGTGFNAALVHVAALACRSPQLTPLVSSTRDTLPAPASLRPQARLYQIATELSPTYTALSASAVTLRSNLLTMLNQWLTSSDLSNTRVLSYDSKW